MSKTKPNDADIKSAFEQTAQVIAYDVFTVCEEMGESPILYRDTVCDYLYCHGGEHGQEVYDWILKELPDDKELDRIGVPKTWT